ncbi:hypothetical protein thsps117_17490 [Pseudomonas sp. No.117]
MLGCQLLPVLRLTRHMLGKRERLRRRDIHIQRFGDLDPDALPAERLPYQVESFVAGGRRQRGLDARAGQPMGVGKLGDDLPIGAHGARETQGHTCLLAQ